MGKRSTRLHQRGRPNVMAPSESPRWSGRACRGGRDSAADQPGQRCSAAQCGPWRGTGVPALSGWDSGGGARLMAPPRPPRPTPVVQRVPPQALTWALGPAAPHHLAAPRPL